MIHADLFAAIPEKAAPPVKMKPAGSFACKALLLYCFPRECQSHTMFFPVSKADAA
jgi:hypothetical protein